MASTRLSFPQKGILTRLERGDVLLCNAGFSFPRWDPFDLSTPTTCGILSSLHRRDAVEEVRVSGYNNYQVKITDAGRELLANWQPTVKVPMIIFQFEFSQFYSNGQQAGTLRCTDAARGRTEKEAQSKLVRRMSRNGLQLRDIKATSSSKPLAIACA